MPFQINISENWRQTYPGAVVGFLALAQVANPKLAPGLEPAKRALQAELRGRYADRAAIKAEPRIQAYAAYYKRFKKTYHVLQQVESVAVKGKKIPKVNALVEVMFMGELKNLLLTAVHDSDRLAGDLRVEVAVGGEPFDRMQGDTKQLIPGDMYMADEQGVISAVLYGADRRSMIQPQTTRALFAVYAPPGIGPRAVEHHLAYYQELAALVAPDCQTELCQVFEARS